MVLELTKKEFDSILHITDLTNHIGTSIVLDNETFIELYEKVETECINNTELLNILSKMLVLDKEELITKTTI